MNYCRPLSFRPTHFSFELFELTIDFVRSKDRSPKKVSLTFLGRRYENTIGIIESKHGAHLLVRKNAKGYGEDLVDRLILFIGIGNLNLMSIEV